MIIAGLVVIAAIAAIGLVAKRADARVADAVKRMEEQTLRREDALNVQAKVFVRKLESSRRVGERALDQGQVLHDEAKRLHANVDSFMSHHKIRRLLDGGE